MSETVFAFLDQTSPAAPPPPTTWVTGSAFYATYWQTISQGLPINDFITDNGGSVLIDPLLYNTFGIFSIAYNPGTDTFTLEITCRGTGVSGNAIRIRMYNSGGFPSGEFVEVTVVSGNAPIGDFGVLWGTPTWVTFSRTFPANALMSTGITFDIHIESDDALNTTFEIANISLTATAVSSNNLILQEDPLAPPDEFLTEGGIKFNGNPVKILSVDSSGLYVLTQGKTDDTLYTRNTGDSTVSVMIPSPLIISGPMGD